MKTYLVTLTLVSLAGCASSTKALKDRAPQHVKPFASCVIENKVDGISDLKRPFLADYSFVKVKDFYKLVLKGKTDPTSDDSFIIHETFYYKAVSKHDGVVLSDTFKQSDYDRKFIEAAELMTDIANRKCNNVVGVPSKSATAEDE
jgi:hypothetical protein